MADFDNIHTLIDETIYPNAHGEINAEEHNAMLHDQLDAIDTLKEDKRFIADPSETTYAEVLAAYNAGREIVCEADGLIYTLRDVWDDGFIFTHFDGETGIVNEWILNTSGWLDDAYIYASDSRVTAIENVIPRGTTANNKLVNKNTMDTEMGQNFQEFQQTITDPIDDRLAAAEGKIPADASPSNKMATAADLVGLAKTSEVEANYVHTVVGKGLSSNDYTAFDKVKVSNLPSNTKAELAAKANANDVATLEKAVVTIVADEGNHDTLGLLCGQPPILFGAGTPQEAIVPDNWNQFDPETGKGYNWNGLPSAIGQQYINTSVSSGGRYVAGRTSYDKANANYYVLKWYNS